MNQVSFGYETIFGYYNESLGYEDVGRYQYSTTGFGEETITVIKNNFQKGEASFWRQR